MEEQSETLKEYKIEYDVYKTKKNSMPKKGAGREEFTLGLLAKFKNKLHTIKEKEVTDKDEDADKDNVDDDESWYVRHVEFDLFV